MRDEWYGDKRDLVKWSVLVGMASQHRIRHILQVAFWQPSPIDYEISETRGKEPRRFDLPREVMCHFVRSLGDIRRLGELTDLTIEVFDKEFSKPRDSYFHSLSDQLTKAPREQLVCFLDPDTGQAPTRATLKHVTAEELQQVFAALRSGDILVLYQHQWYERSWREQARKRFAKALGLGPAQVSLLDCRKLAADVVFLAASK